MSYLQMLFLPGHVSEVMITLEKTPEAVQTHGNRTSLIIFLLCAFAFLFYDTEFRKGFEEKGLTFQHIFQKEQFQTSPLNFMVCSLEKAFFHLQSKLLTWFLEIKTFYLASSITNHLTPTRKLVL